MIKTLEYTVWRIRFTIKVFGLFQEIVRRYWIQILVLSVRNETRLLNRCSLDLLCNKELYLWMGLRVRYTWKRIWIYVKITKISVKIVFLMIRKWRPLDKYYTAPQKLALVISIEEGGKYSRKKSWLFVYLLKIKIIKIIIVKLREW